MTMLCNEHVSHIPYGIYTNPKEIFQDAQLFDWVLVRFMLG